VLQPVDLVDEENVPAFQIGENSGEIVGAFDDGTRGRDQLGPHLRGYDVSECGLAEPGRPVEQAVVERFLPVAGGPYEDAQVLLERLLPDELLEVGGPEPGVEPCVVA
jgi:hypothetical protein